MNTELSAIRYCLAALAAALALVATVGGFNALVDPFGMYRVLELDGLNVYKPSIYRRVRLYKAYELQRVRPQTVVLGSSRTHLGIRCSHEALASLPGPCYNLAFDGATTREMFHYLRHAHAVRPLRHVVLGLDGYHAAASPSFARPDFDPLLLHGADHAWLPRTISADLRLLASLDTLRASIDTVRAQGWPQPNWFAADGQRLGEVFFRREGENFVRHGPRAYFDEIDRLEVGFQTAPAAPKHAAPPPEPDPEETSLAYIRRIVEFCRAHNIELRLFITPAHVHQIEIAAATGGWPAIEDGKRALVALLAADAARHPERPAIPLIDFSGYSPVTTEALPPPDSRAEMAYYWDSSHFKALVGDYVLDRLFDRAPASTPADFGIRLTAASIETILARQRTEQSAYRERFAEDVAALRSMVRARLDTTPPEPMISAAAATR